MSTPYAFSAKVKSDNSLRTIIIESLDVPDLDVTRTWRDGRKRWLKPSRVTLEVVNGHADRITVAGYVLKADGEPGKVFAKHSFGGYYTGIELAPAWLRVIWEEAPYEVIEWGPA